MERSEIRELTRPPARITRSLSSGGASRRPVGSIRAYRPLTIKDRSSDLPVGRFVDRACRVFFIFGFSENYLFPLNPNQKLELSPFPPHRGRIAIATDAGEGCGGRGQRFWRRSIGDGRAELKRLVSDQQRADERCLPAYGRSRVVLTPRRWRQVLRSRVGPNRGLRTRTYPQVMVANKPGSPGEARRGNRLIKPLRAGKCRVISGVLVCYSCAFLPIQSGTRGRGCKRAPRRSPRPSFGAEDSSTASGALRGGGAVKVCLARHCEPQRSNPSFLTRRDGLLRCARK